MSNTSHLIERAAAHLLRSGTAPAGLAGSTRYLECPEDEGAAPANAQAPRRATPEIELARLEGAGLIVAGQGRSRVVEELRIIQQQIIRAAFAALPDAGTAFANLAMITSARPGEGKSFVALNLAANIARQGDHRVVLIDTDPKPSSLGDKLGLREAPGLLDLAADPSLDPERVLHGTAVENLSVMTLGRARERGAELFASKPMAHVLHGLARRRSDRLLVLDASPCLATSDPAALAPVVGQILFVVQAERTQREEVEAGLDMLQTCPAISLLLNKMRQTSRHAFAAYGPYYVS